VGVRQLLFLWDPSAQDTKVILNLYGGEKYLRPLADYTLSKKLFILINNNFDNLFSRYPYVL